MTLVHPVTVSFQRSYDVIPVPFFCHLSSPFFVIPVPRHWFTLYSSAPMMSFQYSFLVIPVAFSSCHPSAPTLGSRLLTSKLA
ncbi:hypothetical protein EUZ93_02905 [Wolbachia pipientis]|nr:hypothetical protein [Wolbachia pipientis]